MVDNTPSKAEIFKLAQAQADSIQELSERLVKIEQLADKQESRNQGIIQAVLVAAVLIFLGLTVQVAISVWDNRVDTANFTEKIDDSNLQISKDEDTFNEFKQCLALGGWKSCF